MSMPSEAGLKTIRGSGGVSNFFQNMTTLSSGDLTLITDKKGFSLLHFESRKFHTHSE